MLATIGIIAGGGFRPAGILVSSYCQSTTGYDAANNYQSGDWLSVGVYTDGVGGFYESNLGENTNGCWHPSGYFYSYNASPSVIFWQNARMGREGYQEGYFTWFITYNWTAADGNGGSSSSGTGNQLAYYGYIINEYIDVAEGLKYITAFDPAGSGSGTAGYYHYTVSSTGMLVSSQCVSQLLPSGYGSGLWYYEETYSDGTGGTYSTIIGENINGCWHPAGYEYSSSQNDTSIGWSHGTSSGNFVYGYTYSYSQANGTGGVINGSGTVVTASDGTVVNSYTINDPTTGYPTNYTLYFSITGNTLQSTEYIVAGTQLSDYCTQINSTDASGTVWNVGSHQYQYANGSGSYYYTDNTNTMECGYLPSGYWTTYMPEPRYFQYMDFESITQSFTYGLTVNGYLADGMGGSTTITDEVTIYYNIGHIFYSYYDEAGQQTVNYAFDGVDSYYTFYS
jgi:hypothetical protein